MYATKPGWLLRFLHNLCAQRYWSFKFLLQTCSVPVWDYFTKPVFVVFLHSAVAGVSVLPPTWTVADTLIFPWFLLDESWCIQHVSSWKVWYIIGTWFRNAGSARWLVGLDDPKGFFQPKWFCDMLGFKTQSHFCVVNLNPSFTQDRLLVLSCALNGTSGGNQQQKHTPEETSCPQSQHLFMYTRFFVHVDSFYPLQYSGEEVIDWEYHNRRSSGVCPADGLITYSELLVIFMENCISLVPVKCFL